MSSLNDDLVDAPISLVDKVTAKLALRAALSYIDLRMRCGMKPPSLDEALLEIMRRFPDKDSLERYTVLHQEAIKDQAELRTGSVLSFRQS